MMHATHVSSLQVAENSTAKESATILLLKTPSHVVADYFDEGGGRILRVQYQGAEQTIIVPHNVPVTQIVPMKEKLQAGDTVYAATEKQPNGTLTTDKVYLIDGPGKSK